LTKDWYAGCVRNWYNSTVARQPKF
jgi:hypothetical protein